MSLHHRILKAREAQDRRYAERVERTQSAPRLLRPVEHLRREAESVGESVPVSDARPRAVPDDVPRLADVPLPTLPQGEGKKRTRRQRPHLLVQSTELPRGDVADRSEQQDGQGSLSLPQPTSLLIRYRVIYNDRSLEPLIISGRFKNLEHFERIVQINAEMDRQTQYISSQAVY